MELLKSFHRLFSPKSSFGAVKYPPEGRGTTPCCPEGMASSVGLAVFWGKMGQGTPGQDKDKTVAEKATLFYF